MDLAVSPWMIRIASVSTVYPVEPIPSPASVDAPTASAPVDRFEASAALLALPDPNTVLDRYEPTGLSPHHARRQGLGGSGVEASRALAEADRARLLSHRGLIERVAADFDLPPALFAALISRESRAGLLLDSEGRGDRGNAFGVAQVDRRFHVQRTEGGPWGEAHLRQAAGILDGYKAQVEARHPSWQEEQQLRGALVAYNSGISNVQSIERMDIGTTGDDFSADVWARALALRADFRGAVELPRWPPPGLEGAAALGTALARPDGALRPNDEGPAVLELQRRLSMAGGGLTGQLGPTTRGYLEAFQRSAGLEPTGIANRESLERLLARDRSWVPAPPLAEVEAGEAVLSERMSGEAVAALQEALATFAGEPVEVDGWFGKGTRAAVEAVQRRAGLPVTGVVDPDTRTAICQIHE